MWDFIVRFRTWLLGVFGVLLMIAPDWLPVITELVNAPEIRDILPANLQRYIAALGFVLMTWSRWRPATRAADPEVQVKKHIDEAPGPVSVKVETAAGTKAVIDAG